MLGSAIRDREGLVTRRHGHLEKADMREMWLNYGAGRNQKCRRVDKKVQLQAQ